MDKIHEAHSSRYEHDLLTLRAMRLVEVIVLVDLVVLQITAIDQLGRKAASTVESVDVTFHFMLVCFSVLI